MSCSPLYRTTKTLIQCLVQGEVPQMGLMGHGKEIGFSAKRKILKGFKLGSFVIGFMVFKNHPCNLL